ncbi:hypothetical protein HDV05_006140 [Chytridiales sp. JEL 0842]|nr:hypothetical protein HDV05_006140 [Chytridiales sp. JEL 0842]
MMDRFPLEHSYSASTGEALFGNPSSSFFLDASNHSSIFDKANNSNSNMNSNNNDNPLHPNVPAFRRARAETFSSFPSKFMHARHASEDMRGVAVATPTRPTHRVRAGSLSLPPSDLANAFGNSIFTTAWQTEGLSGGIGHEVTSPSGSTASSAAAFVLNNNSAKNAFDSVPLGTDLLDPLARTLDYLGLDDANPVSSSSPIPFSNSPNKFSNSGHGSPHLTSSTSVSSSPHFPSPFNRAQTSPRLQGGLEGYRSAGGVASGSGSPLLAGGLHAHGSLGGGAGHHSRSRSYSIAVGEVANALAAVENPRGPNGNGVFLGIGGAATGGRAGRIRSSSMGAGFQPNPSSFLGDMDFGMMGGMQSPQLGQSLLGERRGLDTIESYLRMDRAFASTTSSPADHHIPSNIFNPFDPHQAPTRSVWVGNVDPTLTPSDLLQIFAQFGPIESLRILSDKECAFVNFFTTEDAMRAKDEMQGARIGSTVVKLGFGKVDAINDIQNMQPTQSLWIGNIPATTDPADLEYLFSAFGPIESARVLTHKNCGFVNFDRLEDAIEARKHMNGKEVGGCVLKIGFAKVPDMKPANSTAGTSVTVVGAGGTTTTTITTTSLSSACPSSASPSGNSATSSLGSGPQSISPERSSSGVHLPVRINSVDSTTTGSAASPSINAVKSTPAAEDATAESLDAAHTMFPADQYASQLPALPEANPNRRIDQNRLREMRKKLEGNLSVKEVEGMFAEVVGETVDLCTDYIGNVVIQKILEKSNDHHRLLLIEQVAPHIASIGVHKNGTWVVQKMIDTAKTTPEILAITNAIRPFTPPLLLDQFGNYVVQCCLRLGTQRNQFVFDALHTKCTEIGLGRFGARAMRACLESQYTTKRQQKHVAIAIAQHAVALSMNPNGAILVTWLMDTSSLPGRFRVLAPKLVPHVASLCNHKLGSATILKLVNQRVELEARDMIVNEIFKKEETLKEILADAVQGVALIQKVLASGCASTDEKIQFAERVRAALSQMNTSGMAMDAAGGHQMGYKRLMDELAQIPLPLVLNPEGKGPLNPALMLNFNNHDVVSPLTPHMSFFAQPLTPSGPR